jgi:hypothetical protein
MSVKDEQLPSEGFEHPVIRRKVESEEFLKIITKNRKAKHLSITTSLMIEISHEFQFRHIEISDCTFEREVVFNKCLGIKNINFTDCEFKKRVLFFHSTFSKLKLSRNTFQQYFASKNLRTDYFQIDSCIINNIRELKLNEFWAKEFVFTKNEAENDIYIKPNNVENVIIEGGEKNYLLTFSNNENKETIQKFLFFTYSHYRTDYLLRNFMVQTFQIFGDLKDSSLSINGVKFFSGLINHFSNQGVIRFSSFTPIDENSLIVVKNSTLGKTEISSIDFSVFKKVLITNSNIIDLIPVNIKWCSATQIQSEELSSLRENFRQLKIVSSKNEDVPSKLHFQKLEMHAYLQQLNQEKASVTDRFILGSNYYSNDFGLNWFKAFCWLLITTCIWYTLIKISLGQTDFDILLVPDEIGRFFLFINPIHQFEKIFGIEKISSTLNGAVFFDAASRIFGGYFIYQFISAFRKFSKS